MRPSQSATLSRTLRRLWICVILSRAFWGVETSGAAELELYVPTEEFQAVFCEVGFSPRVQELSLKIQRAAAQDPDWFLVYTRKATPGKPLPYHEKLGVSREEYDEFLKLSKAPTLRETPPMRITPHVDEGGGVRLDAGLVRAELKRIRFLPAENKIEMPFCTLEYVGPVTIDDTTGPLGAWKGVQYRFARGEEQLKNAKASELDNLDALNVTITIGRRKKDQKLFLKFDMAIANHGPLRQDSFTLLWK